MNKSAISLLVVVSLALAGFGFYQSQQVAHYRALAARLEKEAAESRDEAALHGTELRKLQDQTDTQKVAIVALETRNKDLASGARPAAPQPAATDGEAGKDEGGGFMKGLAKMFTDPKMKEAMKAQQSVAVNMLYGDLARELGLAPEDARQVLALLADRQMALTAKSMAAMSRRGLGGDALAAAGKETETAKAEYDDQLKAMLGDDRYGKFQEYEKTMGERMTLDQIQKQLAAGGTPLEPAQTQGLLGIMKEERAKGPNVAPAGNTSAQMKMM